MNTDKLRQEAQKVIDRAEELARPYNFRDYEVVAPHQLRHLVGKCATNIDFEDKNNGFVFDIQIFMVGGYERDYVGGRKIEFGNNHEINFGNGSDGWIKLPDSHCDRVNHQKIKEI